MAIYWNDGTELYHYGVKGQRWGERRYQNEDGSLTEEGRRHYGIKKRRPDHMDMRLEQDARVAYNSAHDDKANAEIKRLTDKAYALAEKYDFDADDGGGGSTRASQRAGENYMRIWDKVSDIESERDYQAKQRAIEEMISKYGKQRYESAKRTDSIVSGARATTAILGTLSGLTYAAVAENPYVALGTVAALYSSIHVGNKSKQHRKARIEYELAKERSRK